MLTSVFLRFISRDVRAIVNFINKLDNSLDAYLAKHDSEVKSFEDEIVAIERKIEDKTKAAAVVLGIKAALPTAK